MNPIQNCSDRVNSDHQHQIVLSYFDRSTCKGMAAGKDDAVIRECGDR
jgi:hypothetical protein